MSIEDNKNIVRKHREAYNTNNMAVLAEVLAPNFVAHDMLPNVPQTPDGAAMLHQGNLAMFPDQSTRTTDLIAEGDLVVERWTMTMHHTGVPFPVGNLPASGKKIEVGGINTYRIKDGKIVETWANMDFMGVLQQIGLIPAPAQSGK
ncbi:MAG TPA: ester cyclase [Anaerolineae bacterium]|nr:ester cyclase [Anaerolineae bacterium]